MQVAEERKLPLPDSKKLSLETFILWVRCTAQGSGVAVLGDLYSLGQMHSPGQWCSCPWRRLFSGSDAQPRAVVCEVIYWSMGRKYSNL